MSEHCGYVVKVKEIRPHENADKLQIATFFGNNTCVSLDTRVGDMGIYFPCDLQLSTEYCEQNNLVRKKDENGNNVGGYMDPDKRNVTAIRLRGERSDGIYMPISTVEYTGVDASTLKNGDTVTELNGHEICCKYIPRGKQRKSGHPTDGNRTRKKKVPLAPLFAEHADTEQLAYNMGAFNDGDQVEITLKMHGTSQRTGYLPVLKGYKRTLWDKITGKEGSPIYDWGYVTGTRRTVLDNYDGGFYGSDKFRETQSKQFEGKLHKGETVYYEVVGFTDTGNPIMGQGDNTKLNDKEFVKKYGKTTTFSYGCVSDEQDGDCNGLSPKQTDSYVYRMTMTNEDGDVVEYTPDFMRYRCEQMGVKTVPVFWKGYIKENLDWNDGGRSAGEIVKDLAEQYYDGSDPIGKTHVREGVVCRIVNKPRFCAYKHKNFSFKCLAGIAIANIENSNEDISEDILSEL